MLSRLVCLLTATLVGVWAQNSSAGLDFGPVDFAGYNNYVYRDNVTSCQIVVTDSASAYAPTRFITAFPNGNTGALVYFVPLNATSNPPALGATLNLSSVVSVKGADNQTGVQGELNVTADLEFGVTLSKSPSQYVRQVGGVRTLRDYVESGGTVFHTVFNYTLGNYSNTSVTLVRNWINGTTVQYLTFDALSNGAFNVTPNSNATLPPNITMKRTSGSGDAVLRFTSTFNFTGTTPETPYVELDGLGRSDLFLTQTPANGTATLGSVLGAIQSNGSAVADQVAFLSYSSKFLAGGWRFLTYFGRDTMLALRLLLPVVSPTTAEAILGAVLERANETGTLCHEETIGDYASFVNMQNNQSDLGNTPSYSYVMLDVDFLLLPVLADYFLAYPQGQNRSAAFLARNSTLKNGTYSQLLLENVNHIMNLSQPFAQDPRVENLVPIRSYPVGNWRDSNSGLGWGIYPFDVESALIPAALRAIAQLATAGILPSNYSANASAYADTWETAYQYFAVPISPAQANASLEQYVSQANLSASLLYGAGALNSSSNTSSGSTAPGFNAAGQTIGSDVSGQNSTFYGLSINENYSVVQVQHSDLGFLLEYGTNVSESVMQAVVEALQPYPRGLLTNVGMVVANAAYDTNTTNYYWFNNLQYHGAVSWSWQQGLMASGLSRQLGLCGQSNNTQLTNPTGTPPAWCNNTALVSALQQAQVRLWDSIVGSAPDLYTEVLSPVFSESNNTFTIGDLGAISPSGTEGDAIQLWSYGFLAQVDPRTGRAVAAGFP